MKKQTLKGKKYFLSAIAGNGVGPFAKFILSLGATVCGSDGAFDKGQKLEIKTSLEKLGIKIFPQDGSGINKEIDVLLRNRIIPDTNPDVAKAMELGVPVKLRIDEHAEIIKDYRIVAIAGTAGKTTTTSMVGHILKVCGLDPTIFVGSEMTNYGTNLVLGDSNIFVMETDESGEAYRSKGFHDIISIIKPEVGIVLNIGNDHFETIEETVEVFENFATNCVQKLLVKNADNKFSETINNPNAACKTVSFGESANANYKITNIQNSFDGLSFEINNEKATMPQIGKHNVLNAAAACCAVSNFGISLREALDALSNFKGSKQRCSITAQKNGITSICDFAHTPQEIESCYKSLTEVFKRVFFVYQPHAPVAFRHQSPVLAPIFNKISRPQDYVYLLKAYNHEETAEKAKEIASEIKYGEYLENILELPIILPKLEQGDAIVLVGAIDPNLFPMSENILDTIEVYQFLNK